MATPIEVFICNSKEQFGYAFFAKEQRKELLSEFYLGNKKIKSNSV